MSLQVGSVSACNQCTPQRMGEGRRRGRREWYLVEQTGAGTEANGVLCESKGVSQAVRVRCASVKILESKRVR